MHCYSQTGGAVIIRPCDRGRHRGRPGRYGVDIGLSLLDRLRFEHHLPADGDIADHAEALTPALDAAALERDLGKVRHVKEVRRHQVAIAWTPGLCRWSSSSR